MRGPLSGHCLARTAAARPFEFGLSSFGVPGENRFAVAASRPVATEAGASNEPPWPATATDQRSTEFEACVATSIELTEIGEVVRSSRLQSRHGMASRCQLAMIDPSIMALMSTKKIIMERCQEWNHHGDHSSSRLVANDCYYYDVVVTAFIVPVIVVASTAFIGVSTGMATGVTAVALWRHWCLGAKRRC